LVKRRTCVYLCNAIDEITLRQRSIDSDSPAATQKVFRLSRALRSTGVRTIILSLGRGRHNGSGRFYRAKAVRCEKVAVVYAPFFQFPVLTHLVTLFGLVPLISRLKKGSDSAGLLVYNRLPFYILAVIKAHLSGYRCFLDLEDGDIGKTGGWLHLFSHWLLRNFFDAACSEGVVLASRALQNQAPDTRVLCCYGVAEKISQIKDWHEPVINVLLPGTLQESTGVKLFIDALQRLRSGPEKYRNSLNFIITGKGSLANDVSELSRSVKAPNVHFKGSVNRETYLKIVEDTHVGLALKLPSSELGDTTFPSKVVEFAENGLLVLSTRVSDVPQLFGDDGAVFITEENADELVRKLMWIVDNRQQARNIAIQGQQRIVSLCSQSKVAAGLTNLMFNEL